jgi:long-subunit acyl-CoA synthetase (AMP-forming)
MNARYIFIGVNRVWEKMMNKIWEKILLKHHI